MTNTHDAPGALGVQRLGDGLQVEHEVGVGPDELADLVDEEVQPKTGLLPVQPLADLLGEVLDRHRILVAVLGEDVHRCRPGLAGDLGVGRGHVELLEDPLLATLRPLPPGDASVGRLELLVLAAVVQVPLESGDVALVAVVAATVVEDLHEHLQQRIGLILADQGRLLVDVEQQALRRNARGLAQQRGQECALGLVAETVRHPLAGELLPLHIPEQVGQHLEQVRLTRTEEAGDPHAVGVGVVGVLLQHRLQALGGLVGQDILVDLGAQMRGVVGLDHTLNRALDILGENLVQPHWLAPPVYVIAHPGCSHPCLDRSYSTHRLTPPAPECSWPGSTDRP